SNELDFMRSVAALEEATAQREKARLKEQLALTGGKQNSLKDQADLRGQIALVDEKSMTRRLKLQNDLNALEDKETVKLQSALKGMAKSREADTDSLQKQLLLQHQANEVIGKSTHEVERLNAA